MNKKLYPATIVLIVVALGLGIYFGNQSQQPKTSYISKLETATVLPQPRAITSFDLTANDGKPYTNKNLIGHWTLFFFGFTNCGYVCPTTMAELRGVYNILQQQKVPLPQVMLISIDPARDTIAKLNQYVKSYNPNFKGATGSEQAIEHLTKDLHILYMKIKTKSASDSKGHSNHYSLDHSGTILLINPEGNLAAIFSMPHKAKQIAHDFALIQKNS